MAILIGLKDVGTCMKSLRRNTQLILALDVTDKKKALVISKRLPTMLLQLR